MEAIIVVYTQEPKFLSKGIIPYTTIHKLWMTQLQLNLWSGAKNTPGLDVLVSPLSVLCVVCFLISPETPALPVPSRWKKVLWSDGGEYISWKVECLLCRKGYLFWFLEKLYEREGVFCSVLPTPTQPLGYFALLSGVKKKNPAWLSVNSQWPCLLDSKGGGWTSWYQAQCLERWCHLTPSK